MRESGESLSGHDFLLWRPGLCPETCLLSNPSLSNKSTIRDTTLPACVVSARITTGSIVLRGRPRSESAAVGDIRGLASTHRESR